jgi:phosphatidylglycerophosphate synthase
VSPARLRLGEWVALAGAVALLVLLALPWYAYDGPATGGEPAQTGLGGLGWALVALVLLAVLTALAFVAATAAERSPMGPIALNVVAVALGVIALLALLVRLVVEPGLGVAAPDGDVGLRAPAWLAPLAALAMLLGAWRALADERTDTAEAREQTERVLRVRGAARPAPPAHSGAASGAPVDAVADPSRPTEPPRFG